MTISREGIYSKKLSEICGIKFTSREIDIITCIVHNRRGAKISELLLISPKTVRTYIRNIMQKLGNNSHEYIISLVKTSGKLPDITKYYSYLLSQNLFEAQLYKIKKVINKESYCCVLHYTKIDKNKEYLLKRLKKHLQIINITLIFKNDNSQENKEQINTNIIDNLVSFKKELINYNKLNLSTSIILAYNNNLNLSNVDKIGYIDFKQEEDYYLSTLKLIKQVLNKPELEQIINEFKTKYQNIFNLNLKQVDLKEQIIPVYQFLPNLLKNRSLCIKFFTLLIFISCCFILVIERGSKFAILNKAVISKKVNSNLTIPHKDILLERSSVLTTINEKLKKTNAITCIALVGIEGAGKTTITHLYASKQNASLIWQINAETKDTIIDSFENLGYTLSRTEEHKHELRIIQEIQDLNKKQEKLILFVQNQLKSYPNWLLIYDNVQTFTDIKDCFPYDSKAWGLGKVILTTRNSAIANNSTIGAEQIIFLEQLSNAEQFELFTKVLNQGNKSTYSTLAQENTLRFLQNIPPFPLDITTVAYYLKETDITYEEYLNRKKHFSEEFNITQEKIFKGKNNYIKNRYSIIILAIKHLIEQEFSFIPLLLLISMIDSQNIPQNLLNFYTNKILANDFLFNLSKYTTIDKNYDNKGIINTFSLHRSTQTIILYYLTKVLSFKNSQLIESIAINLEAYIDQLLETEDIFNIKQLLPHLTAFLEKNMVSELTKAHLTSKLGHIYWVAHLNSVKAIDNLQQVLRIYKNYYKTPNPRTAYALEQLGIAYKIAHNREKAQEYLEKSLTLYKGYNGKEESVEIARLLVNLASVYRKVDYHKAQEYFRKGLALYQRYYGEDSIKTSWVFGNLGRFYRSFGNYKSAKELFERTIAIQQNNKSRNQIEYAWLIINLGITHHNLGNNEKAKIIIKNGISLYQETLEDEHIEIAWARIHLAMVYGNLNNWSKAKQLVQKSLEIYIQHYGEDHEAIAWVKQKLGIVYLELQDITNANNMFNQSVTLYGKYYGPNSAQVAFVIQDIGKMKFAEGDLTTAEKYLNKALVILQNKKHPKVYRVLESLIALYKKRAIYEKNQGNLHQSQIYYTKAKLLTNQFLSVLKDNFPENCFYIKKLDIIQ